MGLTQGTWGAASLPVACPYANGPRIPQRPLTGSCQRQLSDCIGPKSALPPWGQRANYGAAGAASTDRHGQMSRRGRAPQGDGAFGMLLPQRDQHPGARLGHQVPVTG